MLYGILCDYRRAFPLFFRLVLALKLLLSTYFASLHYYLGLLSPWNPRVSFSGLLHARLDSWNNSPCFQDLSVDMQNILSLLGSQLSYNTGISTLKCSTVWLQARVPPDFRLIPALKLLLSTYFASLRYYLGSLLPWNPRISTLKRSTVLVWDFRGTRSPIVRFISALKFI